MAKRETIYLNRESQNDNVYVKVENKSTSELLGGMEVGNNISRSIISNNKLVQTCSPQYHIVDNKDFFGRMEHQLIEEGIGYKMRTHNLGDAKFYVDYILDDESKRVVLHKNDLKGVDDTIVPMIRLTNSYDGKLKTAGHLGFFRKVCHNGMHITQTELQFSVKHTKNKVELFMPNIDEILRKFVENESFSIIDKIEQMKHRLIDERRIMNWVTELAQEEKLFTPTQGLKSGEIKVLPMAQLVEDIVIRDANVTSTEPNAFLLYSAFNEVIHGKIQKSFRDQKSMDGRVFEGINNLINYGSRELVL